MTWRTDPRTTRHFGPFSLVSQVNESRETAHLITFMDGRKLRVLPDDTSGRMRNARVTTALADLEALVANSGPLVEPEQQERYLIGWFHDYRLTFERVTDEPGIKEWLADYFGEHVSPSEVEFYSKDLLDSLDTDGWTIRRAE